MSEDWKCITPPTPSFAGLPVCTQLNDLETHIAIIGIHYVSPYPQRLPANTAKTAVDTAPDVIRRQSSRFIDHLDHYDFDFNDVLLPDRQVRIVDCGDVDKEPKGGGQNTENITAAIRTILTRGAVPVALGTIEGGVIAVLRAYDVIGALCVVHIDAHIDWRNERDGVRQGYSSVIRRVSEMPWVKDMAQVGLRGIGSARQQEVDDALAFGSTFIRAGAVHRERIDSCIEKIPAAEHYLITIDTDAFDTAIAPGVLYPTAGLPLMKPRIWCEALPSKGQLWGLT